MTDTDRPAGTTGSPQAHFPLSSPHLLTNNFTHQIPPADAAAPGSLCRRIDAGGALVLHQKQAVRAAAATLRLALALPPSDEDGEGLGHLRLRAGWSEGSDGGQQGPTLEQLFGGQLAGSSGGGAEASVPLASLTADDRFDTVSIQREDDGPQVVVLCIRSLSVAFE